MAVRDLRSGERLRTRAGLAEIESIDRKFGSWQVFNLEVGRVHQYFISDAEVLAHNVCPDDASGDAAPKPTSQNQMQKQVERGQAPEGVDRVDKPHVPGQQPHVHYEDGTASNVDGSTHDMGKGTPNPSKEIRGWLLENDWKPPKAN